MQDTDTEMKESSFFNEIEQECEPVSFLSSCFLIYGTFSTHRTEVNNSRSRMCAKTDLHAIKHIYKCRIRRTMLESKWSGGFLIGVVLGMLLLQIYRGSLW